VRNNRIAAFEAHRLRLLASVATVKERYTLYCITSIAELFLSHLWCVHGYRLVASDLDLLSKKRQENGQRYPPAELLQVHHYYFLSFPWQLLTVCYLLIQR
jgi:hypothetical protein